MSAGAGQVGAAPGGERARLALAVARAPRDPALRHRLAALLAREGQAEAAAAQYRILLEQRPSDAEAAVRGGLAANRAGLAETMVPLVRRAAEANPGHPQVWQMLALLYRAADDLAPAVDAYRRAAALAPRDARIVHGLARAAFEAGRPAADLFEAARALAPGDEHVILGLAAARNAQEGTAAALGVLEEELRRRPDWIAGHAQVARLRWAQGDREGFIGTLEAALAAAPANAHLWRELLATLMHADQWDRALAAIARGRAALGPGLMFDANEAVCLDESGRHAEAEPLFAALAHVDDPTFAVRHVRHLLRTGRAAEASARAEPYSSAAQADLFWPYLATAWRLTGDPRWEWLEGDERLVGVYDLAETLGPLEALASRLRALHVATHQPLDQSVRGGTQTDGHLLARAEPEIRALRAAIVGAVERHVAQLPPPDPAHPTLSRRRDRPVRFSGSWSVRLTGGGCHANHIHPAGWFSSAFYVALPDEAERGAPPAGWLTLGEPEAELGIDLAPFRSVEPKPGRLVLFPSTMWHGTRPFEAGERMTVAFDVAPPL